MVGRGISVDRSRPAWARGLKWLCPWQPEGVPVAEAVRRAYALYPVMEVMADEVQAQIVAEAVSGYGGALPEGMSDRLFTHSWAPDKLTLSERTTRGGLLVRALVAQAIKKQLRKSTTYRQTALTIFDG